MLEDISLLSSTPWLSIVMGSFLAFSITWLAIPRIVYTARINNLFARENARTSHKNIVPNLGGLAVFSGFMISTILLGGTYFSKDLIYILCSLIIVLFIGMKDDLTFSNPWKKLMGQIIAIIITTTLANIRIENFYGLFRIYEIPTLWSITVTILTFLVLINGINLIDGIDGLASGVGIITSLSFGIWFWLTGDISYAILSFSLSSALSAFFYFNVFSKSFKLFLGDTGSLVIGFVLGILSCHFLQTNIHAPSEFYIKSAPVVTIGIMIIPIYDTLRVFSLRIFQGRSPFSADRQHLHHRLIGMGMNHLQASLILILTNLFYITLCYIFQEIGILYLSSLVIGTVILLSILLEIINNKKPVKTSELELRFEGTWKRLVITKNPKNTKTEERIRSEEPDRHLSECAKTPDPIEESILLPHTENEVVSKHTEI